MRLVICLLIVCAVAGCRSQSTPLANPFTAADRVPPPATRTPAPGTATPYYPGDVAPGATAGSTAPGSVFAPASTALPSTTPVTAPPTTYPLQTTPQQTAPVTPPGGWSQPPTGSVAPPAGGENAVVRVVPDDHNLRIASVPNNNPNDILQVAANQQIATNPSKPFIHTQPVIERQGFPNTVQPAQFASTTSGTATDGFRPQGSSQPAGESVTRAFDQNPTATPEDVQSFGFDATYRSLRGQLQYYPQTGYWGLRYIAQQSTPDSYGGVAVISNPEVLVGVQPGDFLVIQGFLETQDNGDGTFLPLYTVEGIQRQR